MTRPQLDARVNALAIYGGWLCEADRLPAGEGVTILWELVAAAGRLDHHGAHHDPRAIGSTHAMYVRWERRRALEGIRLVDMQAELVARTGRLERFLGREPQPARTEIDTSIRYDHAVLRTAYGKCSDRNEQVESHWRSLDPGGRLYRPDLMGYIQPAILRRLTLRHQQASPGSPTTVFGQSPRLRAKRP
jgi:hypothetical protein